MAISSDYDDAATQSADTNSSTLSPLPANDESPDDDYVGSNCIMGVNWSTSDTLQ